MARVTIDLEDVDSNVNIKFAFDPMPPEPNSPEFSQITSAQAMAMWLMDQLVDKVSSDSEQINLETPTIG